MSLGLIVNKAFFPLDIMTLPINFHRTFIPERRFIGALLKFAAEEKSGDYHQMSDDTGIPMGKSIGKVPAILDYTIGMGLVFLKSGGRNRIKSPVLTDFGRVVFLEDRFMGEPLTQWIAHMNLCRPDIGASAWHQVFGRGRGILGNRFNYEQLEAYLTNVYGPGNNRTGPIVRTYQDDAALARAPALSCVEDQIVRNKAPTFNDYSLVYAAFIISILDSTFPNQSQVTISDLNQKIYWFDACAWDKADIEQVIRLVESTGHISIDRQMQPWILEPMSEAKYIWPNIYNDLS